MTLPATVAVDIGGTKIRAGSVIDGHLAHVRSVPTPATSGAQAVLDTIAEVAAAVIAETQASRDGSVDGDGSSFGSGDGFGSGSGADSGADWAGPPAGSSGSSADPVWRIGVGSAGVIDPATGVVISATDSLAGWAGTELTVELSARTGLPVRAVNDVHAHALGEVVAGASHGSSSSLLAAAGTGIGGGFITDGRLLTGRNSAAGHIGHLPSAAAAGLPCPCGGTGHVEAIASGPAILATYHRLLRTNGPAAPEPSAQPATASPAPDPTATSTRFSASSPANTRELAATASAGDALAVRAFDTGARALGSALGGIVNVLSPEVVVIGGGLAEMGSIWWVPLREAFAAELIRATAGAELRKAELGQDAALIGAAGLWADTVSPHAATAAHATSGSEDAPPDSTTKETH
ncbi:ROK family protein [Brevibacterium spongiae]|uniref:ROK family protein n=1 Tax=Brevibacterium spongiae TaxID=2909672 RepID=A0ABY5SS35_9MICO|nr:ROK family protein [Brevibacterium spongiae]UVI36716.1 ROK family protein [Brevibacterium spongiae]